MIHFSSLKDNKALTSLLTTEQSMMFSKNTSTYWMSLVTFKASMRERISYLATYPQDLMFSTGTFVTPILDKKSKAVSSVS